MNNNGGSPVAHLDTQPEKPPLIMLYTIVVILIIAWLLGFLGVYSIGGFVHIILVVALILLVVQLLTGRRQL